LIRKRERTLDLIFKIKRNRIFEGVDLLSFLIIKILLVVQK